MTTPTQPPTPSASRPPRRKSGLSVLDRKLLRDLGTARMLLVGILAIVTIGVGCFVALRSAYFSLEGARRRYYAECNVPDFTVEFRKAPVTALDDAASLPGIRELQPRISFPIRIELDDTLEPISGRALSMPLRRHHRLNDIVLRRGSYFTGSPRNEVIVEDAFASAHGLGPGDSVDLILNDRRQQVRIVGTAISAEFVYLIAPGSLVPDPGGYGIFYLRRDFAEEVFDFQGACNEALGRLDRKAGPEDLILDRLERRLEPYGVLSVTPLERHTPHKFLVSEIDGLGKSATVLPIVFLGVAALILNVLMTRLAEQQRTVVGTLKAIGYTNRQIFGHFLKFGVVVGGTGGLLGCLMGAWLASLMTSMYQQFYAFPDLTTRLGADQLLTGLAISLGFSIVGTLHGVFAVTRLEPAAAMRPKPPARGGTIGLDKLKFLWRRLGFRWRMVLRSIFRTPMRTFSGMMAASLGSSLMLLAFFSHHAMNHLVEFQYDILMRSDADLVFKEAKGEAVLSEVERAGGVAYAEPTFELACEFHNGALSKRGAITGLIDNPTLTVPSDLEGRPVPVPESGLLMARAMAQRLGLRAGDVVTVVPVRGDRRPVHIPVVRVVDSYIGLSVYADYDYLNHVLSTADATTRVQVALVPGQGSEEELYRAVRRRPAVETVETLRRAKEKLLELMVGPMRVMTLIYVLFGGVMFFGSILNASLIALAERVREIATLRVLGYTDDEVGTIFFRESLLVHMTGAVLGLPVGLGLCWVLVTAYETELFRMPFVFDPWMLVWTLALALVYTVLSHQVVAHRIRKLHWQDALNVRE